MPIDPEALKIPKIFYSDAKGKPFEKCIDCDRELLKNNTEYIIEKALKKYVDYDADDTIFEYAICLDCAEKLFQSFSKTSRQAIENYFEENVDIEARLIEAGRKDNFHINDFINKCMIKGSPIENLQEYQLVCYCKGDKISMIRPPYMVCGEASDEVMQLLSNATIDILNGFTDDFLGIPPEFRDLLKDKPALVL
ncbi:MAG: hypothetical protein P8X42_17790 [Calditrichaceae bacterium]|jgi:hypothetical protein